MLSFRLDPALLRKVDMERISWHHTRRKIIREALELCCRACNPVLTTSTTPDESDAHS